MEKYDFGNAPHGKSTYRLPTVAIVGGGAAGVAAAAECALIGFKVLLFDDKDKLGGRYAGPHPATPPRGFGFRKNNLRHTKVRNPNAEEACQHIAAALTDGDYTVYLNTRITAIAFDNSDSQWNVKDNEGQTHTADVVIVANGIGTIETVTTGKGYDIDLNDTHHHLGVEPIGVPNILVIDGPEPPQPRFFARPLDLVEAKANHCQDYVRQLEVIGPAALFVNKSMWTATPNTWRSFIASLGAFNQGNHEFNFPEDKGNQPKKKQTSEHNRTVPAK